jgi:hypothetical protein
MKKAKKTGKDSNSKTIRSEKLFYHKHKKVYYFDQKEKHDGKVLKMTEASGGKRNTIIVPDVLVEPYAAKMLSVMRGGEEDGTERMSNERD